MDIHPSPETSANNRPNTPTVAADVIAWSITGVRVWSSPAGNALPISPFSWASKAGFDSSTSATDAKAIISSGTSASTLK